MNNFTTTTVPEKRRCVNSVDIKNAVYVYK